MALNSYDDLVTKVADYLNRVGATAITDQVPDFIALAELSIYRRLRLPVQEVVALLPITTEGKVNIPVDFLEVRDISYIGARTEFLSRRPYREVERLSDTNVHGASSPRMWARQGQSLLVAPVPDTSDSNIRLIYYQSFDALGAANQTNFFTDNAPDVILFGALYEAAIFMKDAEMEARYQKRFEIAMTGLQDEADLLEWGGNGHAGNIQ